MMTNDKPINPAFMQEYDNTHNEHLLYFNVLKNTLTDYEYVMAASYVGSVCHVYLCEWHYDKSVSGRQMHIEESSDAKAILYAINMANDRFVKCDFCGFWVPEEHAHHYCPAGVSCINCIDKANEAEKDFFSMPLD